MSLTISPFDNPWQNHNKQMNHKRSVKSLDSYSLVWLQNKSNPTTNFWKVLQEESSWHGRLSQPVFLKYLNKTYQGIMCETEIKVAFIKKHVYKERKETIHVEVGEENIHHIYIYIYISKISTMYVKMVTKPMYKKLKEAPKTTMR